MDTVFSSKGLLLLDLFLAVWLALALQGQLQIMFSAQGRIKRLTFWEGLAAWFVLNVFGFVLGIAHSAAAFDEQLATNFGDTDHVWYHRLVLGWVLCAWLGSSWILAVLCAKRWHDLNFSGWFALINATPVLTLGYAGYIFLSSLPSSANRMFATRSNLADLSREVATATPTNLAGWSAWSLILSCGLLLALGAYLGFARGDTGANAYGKSSV